MKSMSQLPAHDHAEPSKGLIGQLLAAIERGKYDREVRRMKAHIAWTPEQRAALLGRSTKKR